MKQVVVGEVRDNVFAFARRVNKRIGTRAARERVIADAAPERVVACIAVKFVVAFAARKIIVAVFAIESILARTAEYRVIQRVARDSDCFRPRRGVTDFNARSERHFRGGGVVIIDICRAENRRELFALRINQRERLGILNGERALADGQHSVRAFESGFRDCRAE